MMEPDSSIRQRLDNRWLVIGEFLRILRRVRRTAVDSSQRFPYGDTSVAYSIAPYIYASGTILKSQLSSRATVRQQPRRDLALFDRHNQACGKCKSGAGTTSLL